MSLGGLLFFKSQLLFYSLVFGCLCLVITPQRSFAKVQLIFLSQKTASGELVQFEKNGQFIHSAISFQNKWLQAHPYYGVQLVSLSEVLKMGTDSQIMTLDDVPDLTESDILPFLGKKFDRDYSWDDDRIYCSELLAKLLNIPPKPMFFDPKLWPAHYQKLNGEPGVSPDEIARYYLNKGYFLEENP